MKHIFSFITLFLYFFSFQTLTAEEAPIKKRILLGSPIRQNPIILQEFCDSLDRLEKTSYTFDYCFIDDNNDVASSVVLRQFACQHLNQCIFLPTDFELGQSHYFVNEIQHIWTDDLVWKVAAFKNKIIELAKNQNYDYLFLIDSDLVLHPKTIEQLLSANKDIISNIFWTSWQPNTLEMPQVWVQDQYNFFEIVNNTVPSQEDAFKKTLDFFAKLRKPGVHEVGGLGACTLISRNALMKGISFDKIKNVSFWGEDRHFCIRASALGISLFVDTHYPAYHIYRISALCGLENFKKQCEEDLVSKKQSEEDLVFQNIPKPRLTLSMIVRNEADKYLKDVLLSARDYITDAVIIDDASTDNTVAVCREILKDIPLKLIVNEQSKFSCECSLREQQWNEVVKTNPDWIICLDADEIFEKKFKDEIKKMIENPDADAYYFRLYDFWDPDHYREDEYWRAHFTYRPFLVKYQPGQQYTFQQSSQHCGRFPLEVHNARQTLSNLRLKHYGWADEKNRKEKYLRYKKLDPNSKWCNEQYDSILDSHPNLITWQE
jgi:glycosyltransferase involved in cell wall biosynthesis